MYCTKCGSLNDDKAITCTNCGTTLKKPPSPQQPSVKIPTYLIPAILATLLCCVPLGIPAIYFAAQVNLKIAMGDLEGAKATSNKAKIWFWVSFGVGLIVGIAYFTIVFLGLMAEHF